MNNDEDLPQAFRLPDSNDHPATIAARLMREPEHEHLADNYVSFGWLMRVEPKDKGGKRELGSVHQVKSMFQGAFKDLGLQLLQGMLGYLPEFLVVLDAGAWADMTDNDRAALVWHELAHVKQQIDRFGAPKFDRNGMPVYGICEHDVAAFRSEVKRFGLWSEDLRAFVAVARDAD